MMGLLATTGFCLGSTWTVTTALVSLLAASAIVQASATGRTGSKTCESFKIPVTVTTTNLIFAPPPFRTDFDVVDFVGTISSRSAPPPSAAIAGVVNQTATYTISATFCKPASGHGHGGSSAGPAKDVVLIATHGLNFDRSYWDPEIDPETYSFVDYAVGLGYSVLYYDRLGVGKSSTVSGYTAQLSTQAAILLELASKARQGTIGRTFKPAAKIVFVGHSFGSSISLAATAAAPAGADAVVLTGFGFNVSIFNGISFLEAVQPRIASQQRPKQWGHLDSGYLTGVDLYSNVITFFKQPWFKPEVGKFAEDNKQPFAIMEFLSAAGDVSPLPYTGPVLLISGKYDFIFCTSDCDGGLEHPAAEIFPASKVFKAISFNQSAHGLNFHYTAPMVYTEIFDFLRVNGF